MHDNAPGSVPHTPTCRPTDVPPSTHLSGTVAVALTFKSKILGIYNEGKQRGKLSGVKVTPLCHCHCHSKVVHGHRHCLLSVQLAGHHSGTVAVALTFKSKIFFCI